LGEPTLLMRQSWVKRPAAQAALPALGKVLGRVTCAPLAFWLCQAFSPVIG